MKFSTQQLKAAILLISTILFFLFTVPRAEGQIQMAPTALYLDDDNKTGRIVLRNSSSEPQELNIELIYGYPDTDEGGNVYLKKFTSVSDEEPSAAEWIRVYPRNLVLPPNEQQTIRFAARPPADIEQAEYWVRPAISVRNVEAGSSDINDRISATINLIKRTILSINYRHGNVRTGISIPELTAETEGDMLVLMAELDREGNAAYLGHTVITIYDRSGNLQQEVKREIAVYKNQKRKFEVDMEDLSPGTYRAELTLSTETRSGENEHILDAPSASQSVEFTIK